MKKVKSHSLVFQDFNSSWYKKWATELKQDPEHLDGHALRANKFWQNAVMCEILHERHKLKSKKRGIGFGVGQERLPAVFAKHKVRVMATDQHFNSDNASHWVDRELATDSQSLNKLGICDQDTFNNYVEFRAVDMMAIPREYSGKYDFLWSNCALGHLGSISKGLAFIDSSLRCLKPGGVAVHTTEINVMSDYQTAESGDTVIFRLSDVHKLYRRLIGKGYICEYLHLSLGDTNQDFRISMQPKFGNDYSKIQVNGYIATQAVLIIVKPKYPLIASLLKPMRLLFLRKNFHSNSLKMVKHISTNPDIQQLLESEAVKPDEINLEPLHKQIHLNIKRGQPKETFIEYKNNSTVSIYSFYGHLINTKPVVLATDNPKNRSSLFYSKDWVIQSKDRPSSDFFTKTDNGDFTPVDKVEAGQTFAFRVVLDPHQLKRGHYVENFKAVLEGLAWVKNSGLEVIIDIE